jgi:Sulfatase
MHDPASPNSQCPPPRCPIFQSVLGGVVAAILFAASPGSSGTALAQASAKKPNILVIMGDDVGWFNIGAYHRGIMSGKTPNLNKLADEGMMFTDYYAEASCTAGRANFITGASCQSARVSPPSARRAPISACRTRPSPSPPC